MVNMEQTSTVSKLGQPFGCVYCSPNTNVVNYSGGAAVLRVYLPSITEAHQREVNRLGWKATWREINRKLMNDQSNALGKSLKTHASVQRSLQPSSIRHHGKRQLLPCLVTPHVGLLCFIYESLALFRGLFSFYTQRAEVKGDEDEGRKQAQHSRFARKRRQPQPIFKAAAFKWRTTTS